MSTLILITSHFPFEPGEAFIETEFPIIYPNFRRVIIIARNVKSKKLRAIPDDVKVYRYNPTSTLSGYIYIPVLFCINIKRIAGIYRDEIRFRNEIRRSLSFSQKLLLLKKIIKGLQLRNFIKAVINEEKIEGIITFYSYWLNNGAHAISMLDQNNIVKIARAHRIELYEEATHINYLPLLKYTFLNLDGIFFISQHGKEYFEDRIEVNDPKNQVSRLGTIKPNVRKIQKSNSGFFRIISCSNLTHIKRIDLIILALENLKTEKKVIWNHFGEGKLIEELSDLAHTKLGHIKNIEFQFMGQVTNSELLDFYNNNKIDLFLNTSSSEGIPVSIMEAQSFGIPVIATNVGGVRELVTKGTGSLIPPDFKPEELAEMIQFYANFSEEAMDKIRIKAFNNWKSNFNGSANYKDFLTKVNSILASAN